MDQATNDLEIEDQPNGNPQNSDNSSAKEAEGLEREPQLSEEDILRARLLNLIKLKDTNEKILARLKFENAYVEDAANRNMDQDETEITVDDLKVRIEELKPDLFNASALTKSKEIVALNAELAMHLHRRFTDGLVEEEGSSPLEVLIGELHTTSSMHLGIQEENEIAQKKLDKHRKKYLALLKETRTLQQKKKKLEEQLKEKKEQRSDDKIKKLREELADKTANENALRAVLKDLVIGSKVNWTEDQNLYEVLMEK